jgi:hypothetical protein
LACRSWFNATREPGLRRADDGSAHACIINASMRPRMGVINIECTRKESACNSLSHRRTRACTHTGQTRPDRYAVPAEGDDMEASNSTRPGQIRQDCAVLCCAALCSCRIPSAISSGWANLCARTCIAPSLSLLTDCLFRPVQKNVPKDQLPDFTYIFFFFFCLHKSIALLNTRRAARCFA